MIDAALGAFFSAQSSRPFSLAVAVFALFVPSSLTIFLSNPMLFATLGINGVLLLSVGISLPIIMLCFSIWWTPLTAIRNLERIQREGTARAPDLETELAAEDPLEWPCLLTGSWTANFILFVVAAIAYYRPLRIGATYLLLAALLGSLWLIVSVLSVSVSVSISRKLAAANSPQQITPC
jgi:hypothetical protein